MYVSAKDGHEDDRPILQSPFQEEEEVVGCMLFYFSIYVRF